MNNLRKLTLTMLIAAMALLGAACSGDAEEAVDDAVDQAEEAAGDAADAAEDAIAEATTFDVTLTGDAEVPGPGADGTGTATVTVSAEEVCVEGSLDGVESITAGHIHEGDADAAGGVVVDLGVATEDGTFSSCGEVDAATAGEIIATPASFYLNLHNADFPDGAVRGQLS